MRIYANYIITDSIHIGDTEFVLGVSAVVPGRFITWKCTEVGGYRDGHDCASLPDAQADLVARAVQEIERNRAMAAEPEPVRCTEEIAL